VLGKENDYDSLSSGERKGKSLNQYCVSLNALQYWGCEIYSANNSVLADYVVRLVELLWKEQPKKVTAL